MLSYEKLDVYQCALDFFALSASFQELFPSGYGALANQARRASTSILLNIAEAAGKQTSKERKYHYSVARGSAYECAAIVDALRVLEAVDSQRYDRSKKLLARIVAMLTRMCQ